jgi:alanine-synthesizing transaminase
MGALYAFIGVRSDRLPTFDDQQFALDLLEHKHVLVAPGSSFNVPYRNYFRITNLPEPRLLTEVFARIEALLESYAAGERPAARQGPDLRLVDRLC